MILLSDLPLVKEAVKWGLEAKLDYQVELERAESARRIGNEGMARVCARRAAGLIITRYLEKQEWTDPGGSAYDRLRWLSHLAQAPVPAKEISRKLMLRVNVEHELPPDLDLIAEVRQLAGLLLGED